MSERRGRLLVDGRLRAGTLGFDHDSGRITDVTFDAADDANVDLPILSPGLIDLHVHGFGGHAATADGLPGMAQALASVGTTSFQPTLFPSQPSGLGAEAAATWAVAERLQAELERSAPDVCARPLGLHLEGPFVNPLSAGALPRSGLAEPSVEALRAILGPATGDGHGIRTMTIAPELPGSMELVAELARCGVRASLGHSRATRAEAHAASAVGAAGVTHLYNAMPGLHHREIGLVGFALSSDALFAELIGDLVHVGADAVDLTLSLRGIEGIALVSDALAGAGTGCDVFESHGHTCRVGDGAIWIDDPGAPDGRRLTGAAAPQLEAVRRLTSAGVLSIEEALHMATETPARALGLEAELGRLAVGARADVLVLGPGLALEEVLIGGISFRGAVPGFAESDR